MLIHLSHNIEFNVNPEQESYGVNWYKFQNKDYEPDTIAFLAKYVDSSCFFLDCGAAVGTISLVAASLGARVIAYEPMEHIFELAKANIELNPKFQTQIELKKCAVGDHEASIAIIGKSERRIISEIVSRSQDFQDKPIKVVDLKTELEKIKNEHIIIKMDIEGAEFSLLNNEKLLSTLKEKKIICILALHPGFTRPLNGNIMRVFRKAIWKIRNFSDCYILFNRIAHFGKIKRSNEAIVDSPMKFALLTSVGVYEYILDFRV